MSCFVTTRIKQNDAARAGEVHSNSNRRYVMRITGYDNEGKEQLSYFIDNDEPYPVIATTSKLLNTGVDAKPVR